MSAIKVTTIEESVAVVPYILGFHPEDSLVVLPVGGGQVSLCRIDLDEEAVEPVASPLARNGVTRAAVMLFTADSAKAGAVAKVVKTLFPQKGIEVVALVRVHDDTVYEDGRGYRPVPTTCDAVMELVAAGHSPAPRRSDLAKLFDGDPAPVEAALANVPIKRLQWLSSRQGMVEEAHWVQDRVRQYLTDRDRLSDEDVARLLPALRHIEIRDVAWSEMTRDTAKDCLTLWLDVASRTPHGPLAVPPLALAAFSAWLAGNGALAHMTIEKVQEIDPHYRMVQLLDTALNAAMPPSQWEPETDHPILTEQV